MTPPELRQKAARYRQIAYTIPPHLPGPQNREYYLKMADDLERQADEIDNPQSGDNGTSKHKKGIDDTPQGQADDTPQGDDNQQQNGGDRRGQADDLRKLETLSPYVNYHSVLAQIILKRTKQNRNEKRYKPMMRFSYAVRCLWQTSFPNVTWFYLDDFLALLEESLPGKHRRTYERWLQIAKGIFFEFGTHQGRKTISKIGMHRIFEHFGIDGVNIKPGRVIRVPLAEILSGDKQDLHAALSLSRFNGKDRIFGSRKTWEKVHGISARSQQTYDKINNQTIVETQKIVSIAESPSIKPRPDFGGKMAIRKPNIYIKPDFEIVYPKQAKKRYGLYKLNTAETNVSGQGGNTLAVKATGENVSYFGAVQDILLSQACNQSDRRRLLYDNPKMAKRASERRFLMGETSSVFTEVEPVKNPRTDKPVKGKVILRQFDCSQYHQIDDTKEVMTY